MQRNFTIRYAPLLLLLAFAINAIVPFFAVYNPSVSNTEIQRLTSVFGEKILLCTGDGFKWVSLADLQSGKEKPKPHSGDKCPLCYAASHGLKSLTVASEIIAQDNHRNSPHVSAHYNPHFVPPPLASPLNMRAPPISFIG